MPPNNSQNPTNLGDVELDWEGLAKTISQLPKEDREKYIEMMLTFIHNLRQSISIVYAVEALLRRMITEDNLENPLELLNVIQIAYQRMVRNIESISNAFDPYDK